MLKFFPELIAFLSLAVIVVMILRRIPDVTIPENGDDSAPNTFKADLRRASATLAKKLQVWSVDFFHKTLHYLAVAKDYTIKTSNIVKFAHRVVPGPAVKRDPSPGPVNPGKTPGSLGSKRDGRFSGNGETELLERIKKDPDDSGAYELLGDYYLDARKFADAREVFEYLSGRFPQNDSYFSRLGTALFDLRQYEGAIAAYRAAIHLRPELPNRHVNLSFCYEELGQLDQAIEAVRRALKISPDNVKFLHVLADYEIRSEKKEAAQSTLEHILELIPTDEAASSKLMRLKF
ncbi:MAG: tetratricopeptide repeat protein [Candidatus Doudnabacteria bacterium]|nr:tetratricopeptide repeat protein [Candidatus Doudnabacteria bacterium]